ncbi:MULTISPECIES: alpha/beta hydrolase [unclassified Aureimonas]|uniref:alpha/beta hydrolase n=1 Tax=unclassified Aureimonas TaxID=2615206 RepID=UPI0006F1F279|nr:MULTISPECIES: alpha/beta hydrolase [unclassified Aureimonas]KQT64223.1 2-hydroxymuconic semialdehyde hydrolase [Aureimonas sp. Leaf427]KQT81413.1 2-hydroxymuconic semialdehyde hydrolase [Aureimonas sp. Leaf460]
MTSRIDPALPAGVSETGAERAAPAFLTVGEAGDARSIAHLLTARGETSLLWLGGYGSDMHGAKAERLDATAGALDLTFCRFDYSGHGSSSGAFEDGTITRWTDEAEAVADRLPGRQVILAGSSMGAWIALRLAQRRRARGLGQSLSGLLLLAPAPDFTKRLVEPKLREDQRRDLETLGFCTEPSPYGPEPTIYTRALIEDGRRNLVMDGLIETGCPVHIIQGMADADVPYRHALDLVSCLPSEGVVLTLVRDGDHRLSRPTDLDRMDAALRGLVEGAR